MGCLWAISNDCFYENELKDDAEELYVPVEASPSSQA